ncbi:MAG: hypothetical protein SVU32_04295 [Candidatus Nanohaloarchaea archaeon]|nr:hypothetical protein [Candidatus Nanohaloarchaea archaeon]
MSVQEPVMMREGERPPHPDDVLEYFHEHWDEIVERYPSFEDMEPADATFEYMELYGEGEEEVSYDAWSREAEVPTEEGRYVQAWRIGEAEDDTEVLRIRGEIDGELEELTYLPE